MTTDYMEVVPVTTDTGALSRRRHIVRRVDGHNGQTEWVSEPYANRSNGVRAARKAAAPEGLAVKVLDATGELCGYYLLSTL